MGNKEGKNMVGISEFIGSNPYPDVPFVEVEAMVGKNVSIIGVTPFESTKGKGVHALLKCGDDELRICTHSLAITNILSKEEVKAALEAGETIDCRIVKRQSKNGRPMLALEDQ